MKTSIEFVGFYGKKDGETWEHYRWHAVINGVSFEYKTGTGHAIDLHKPVGFGFTLKPKERETIICHKSQKRVFVPKIDEILWALISDMRCGENSFPDFCSEFGYEEDSRKALETYLSCQANGAKLRRALGADLQKEIERIDAMEM